MTSPMHGNEHRAAPQIKKASARSYTYIVHIFIYSHDCHVHVLRGGSQSVYAPFGCFHTRTRAKSKSAER